MTVDATQPVGLDARVKRRVLVATVVGAGLVFLDWSVANVALAAIRRHVPEGSDCRQLFWTGIWISVRYSAGGTRSGSEW